MAISSRCGCSCLQITTWPSEGEASSAPAPPLSGYNNSLVEQTSPWNHSYRLYSSSRDSAYSLKTRRKREVGIPLPRSTTPPRVAVMTSVFLLAFSVAVSLSHGASVWEDGGDGGNGGDGGDGGGAAVDDGPYVSDWAVSDGWSSDPAWTSGGRLHHSKCVDIPVNMTLCHNIGYHQMRLPNLLEHDTLNEMTQQARQWVPLLRIGCHDNTKMFLCSLFSPVCLDRPIWPCRYVHVLTVRIWYVCVWCGCVHRRAWHTESDCGLFPVLILTMSERGRNALTTPRYLSEPNVYVRHHIVMVCTIIITPLITGDGQ